jgi:hypothetical protein
MLDASIELETNPVYGCFDLVLDTMHDGSLYYNLGMINAVGGGTLSPALVFVFPFSCANKP